MLDRGKPAPQTVTQDWCPVGLDLISGVTMREVKNVVVRSGVLTELYRPEWFDPGHQVQHAAYMAMLPHSESSWHAHRRQTDIIMVVRGQLRIGLFDDRAQSPTHTKFNLFHLSIMRPTLVFVPTGVWHAVKNATPADAAYVVFNDKPYDYEDPDDWIVAAGDERIPHRLD